LPFTTLTLALQARPRNQIGEYATGRMEAISSTIRPPSADEGASGTSAQGSSALGERPLFRKRWFTGTMLERY